MNLRDLIIRWNNDNPLDKKFREKYNIPFNSPQHRQTNQLDILMEYVEEEVFKEFRKTIETSIEKEKQYQAGQWLQERQLSSEESQDLFDKIDIMKINTENSQIKVET